ncbi:MAG: M28 family peptidase, partial [Bacteroidales bacterium]|nr:M28 family peptidase [Bacteroidales bacterium]
YYCGHPVFPMEKTAACINFDCIAPEPLTRDVVVLGGGKCELDRYITACAGAQGRYVVFNEDNSDGWFFRSDHFNFVKRGVPAVVIEYGTDLVDPSHPNKYPRSLWYHKPSDEYREDWVFDGTVAHVNMMFGVGLSVANAESRPAWYSPILR